MHSSILEKISQIISSSKKLKQKFYPDFQFKYDYVTLFTTNEEEYKQLEEEVKKLGEIKDNKRGIKIKLNQPFQFEDVIVRELKVRNPDLHSTEIGFIDFLYNPSDYSEIREIAMDRGFRIKQRIDMELIQIADQTENAFIYITKDLK